MRLQLREWWLESGNAAVILKHFIYVAGASLPIAAFRFQSRTARPGDTKAKDWYAAQPAIQSSKFGLDWGDRNLQTDPSIWSASTAVQSCICGHLRDHVMCANREALVLNLLQ